MRGLITTQKQRIAKGRSILRNLAALTANAVTLIRRILYANH